MVVFEDSLDDLIDGFADHQRFAVDQRNHRVRAAFHELDQLRIEQKFRVVEAC